ncbi:MAG: hypothetical protein KDK99_05150 [Verrucomicrobiales bacterium]|nr:hypothetical protein [Verrucomicrobiales bacterium]
MPFLPKRPLPYITALLLLILIIMAVWMLRAVTSPEIRRAIEEKKQAADDASPSIQASAADADSTPAPRPPLGPVDPFIEELTQPLDAPEGSVEQDLEIVREVFRIYQRVEDGNPVGLNEDITAAITGANPQGAVVFPPGHRAIVEGQLVDRWGTPFWFHPLSGREMEIRSAGPDRELFTQDDFVLGNSGVSDQGTMLAE